MSTLVKFEQLRDKARERIACGARNEPAGKLRRWAEIINECETAVTQLRNLAERSDRLAQELEDGKNPSPPREVPLAPQQVELNAVGPHRPTAEVNVDGGIMGATNWTAGKDQRSKAQQKEIVKEDKAEWVRRLSLKGIPLRQVEGRRVFRTQSGKLVGVACANEDSRPGMYWLGLPDKQFDVVVLLCRDSSGELFDFILPAHVVSQIWPSLSRDYNGERKLHVSQVGPNFKLVEAPTANLKLIDPYLSRHDLLR